MSTSVLVLLLAAGAGAAPPQLDPNRVEFPDSALLDYGPRATAPVGSTGFLKVDEAGHFVWADGRRARFWGINLANDSVVQPPERIDLVIERIRRAGFNLVRLHHLDDPGRGILAPGSADFTFDPARLKLLDYWIDRLGKAGLHVYLDLLDYRTFGPAEAVDAPLLGRGAKPYAVFHDRLIASQQRYAKALLRDHVNAYNGLPYAADPTVALLELYDENGLFIRRMEWLQLREPYRAELTARWNRWLLGRYGSTAGLVAAWSRSGVARPLAPGQRLETGTVPLAAPRLAGAGPALTPAARLERARSSDAARFADAVHTAYFRTMRDYLRRDLGVQAPLTAIGDFTVVPDLNGVARELDFVGTNYYFDHPVFRPGAAWQAPYFFQLRNPLQVTDTWAMAPGAALARIVGKPLVVREWNHCYPNPYRAAGMVEATAYAALQDVDAMLLFTYGAVDTQRHVSYFDVHQDPARWGLAAILGEVFRSGVSPARRRIDLGFSATDTFLFKQYRSPLHALAHVSRVGSRCFGDRLQSTADLTIASGRSSAGRYQGGPLLLHRGDPAADTLGTQAAATPDLFGYPVPVRQGATGLYQADGTVLFPAGPVYRVSGARFPLSVIRAVGAQPIASGDTDALGFRDETRRIYGFGPLSDAEQFRAALDVLERVYHDGVGHSTPQRQVSDTGELDRNATTGRLLIRAARAAGVAGNLQGGPHDLGAVRLTCDTARGAAVVVSLDNQPLATCRQVAAKFVSDAANTGQQLTPPGADPAVPDRWRLDSAGTPPIQTGGQPGPGWQLDRGGTPWFTVGQSGGTAEVLAEPTGWTFYSDTPGARIDVPGVQQWVAVPAAGAPRRLPPGPSATWPADAVVLQGR